MVRMDRNYAKETAYENRPEQVARREARNKARLKAERAGRVHKGDSLEVDHLGHHRTGSLDHVATEVVTQHENRIRQPKHKVQRNKS